MPKRTKRIGIFGGRRHRMCLTDGLPARIVSPTGVSPPINRYFLRGTDNQNLAHPPSQHIGHGLNSRTLGLLMHMLPLPANASD